MATANNLTRHKWLYSPQKRHRAKPIQDFRKSARMIKIPTRCIKSTTHYERMSARGAGRLEKMSRGFINTWQPIIWICKWQPDLNINSRRLRSCQDAKRDCGAPKDQPLRPGSLIHAEGLGGAKVTSAVMGTKIRQRQVNPLAIRSGLMVIHIAHADNTFRKVTPTPRAN